MFVDILSVGSTQESSEVWQIKIKNKKTLYARINNKVETEKKGLIALLYFGKPNHTFI